jgi:hypothetical protein
MSPLTAGPERGITPRDGCASSTGVLFENSIVCLVVFVCCFWPCPVFPFVGVVVFLKMLVFGVFAWSNVSLIGLFLPLGGLVFVWRV